VPIECPYKEQTCQTINGVATCSLYPSSQSQINNCPPGVNPKDISCCPPGFYGNDPKNCIKCPSNKPVSNGGNPDSDCKCNNTSINKCFACDPCRPYDSKSGKCVPIECSFGSACKVQNGKATCA